MRISDWSSDVCSSDLGLAAVLVLLPQKEEEGMKMDLNIQRKKPFRITPLLFRTIHKWVGLVLGIQFVLWTVSGATMALLDMETVGGHAAAPVSTTAAPWPSDLAPLDSAQVEGLTLRRIPDRPLHEVRSRGRLALLDAQPGGTGASDQRPPTGTPP